MQSIAAVFNGTDTPQTQVYIFSLGAQKLENTIQEKMCYILKCIKCIIFFILCVIILVEKSYWQFTYRELKLAISFPEHFLSLYYQSIHSRKCQNSIKSLLNYSSYSRDFLKLCFSLVCHQLEGTLRGDLGGLGRQAKETFCIL